MITTNTAVSVLKMARNVGKFLLHQIKSDLRTKVKIFSLEQAMKAERRHRYSSFFDLGARWGKVVNATSLLYRRERDPGWAPGPVWTGAKDRAPTGI
jgi:hypothetical protein